MCSHNYGSIATIGPPGPAGPATHEQAGRSGTRELASEHASGPVEQALPGSTQQASRPPLPYIGCYSTYVETPVPKIRYKVRQGEPRQAGQEAGADAAAYTKLCTRSHTAATPACTPPQACTCARATHAHTQTHLRRAHGRLVHELRTAQADEHVGAVHAKAQGSDGGPLQPPAYVCVRVSACLHAAPGLFRACVRVCVLTRVRS